MNLSILFLELPRQVVIKLRLCVYCEVAAVLRTDNLLKHFYLVGYVVSGAVLAVCMWAVAKMDLVLVFHDAQAYAAGGFLFSQFGGDHFSEPALVPTGLVLLPEPAGLFCTLLEGEF